MSTGARTILDGARGLVAGFLDATTSSTHRRLGDVAGVAVTTAGADGGPLTVGASTSLARDVDRIQYETGDGPCLQTLRTGDGLYVPDLAADTRWGEYGARAADRGARCCISVPVVVETQPVAVFKVYGSEPESLSREQRDLAQSVGQEIAGGFALALHLTQLATELDDMTAMVVHRRVIDLALGISMQRAQVDAPTAFKLLRTQSQHRNVKLTQVAGEVVASIPGATPDDLVPPYDPHV